MLVSYPILDGHSHSVSLPCSAFYSSHLLLDGQAILSLSCQPATIQTVKTCLCCVIGRWSTSNQLLPSSFLQLFSWTGDSPKMRDKQGQSSLSQVQVVEAVNEDH